MKLLNGDIPLFTDIIMSLPLNGKKLRLRTRLATQLINYYRDVVDKERLQLLDEYTTRNEDGEVIYQDIERKNPLLKEEFYREVNELYGEFYIIENNESNKDILLNICDILLDDDCELTLSGQHALIFDKWCVELEATQEYYEKLNNQTESE